MSNEISNVDECWHCGAEIDLNKDRHYMVVAVEEKNHLLTNLTCAKCKVAEHDPDHVFADENRELLWSEEARKRIVWVAERESPAIIDLLQDLMKEENEMDPALRFQFARIIDQLR